MPISTFGEALIRLNEDMFDTMKASNGLGLAGPQVGILEKICVVEFEGTRFTLINPEIIEASGADVMEEGCLSIPNQHILVERFTKIKVKTHTLKGDEITLSAKDFTARIMQHEIDHLNGILITDKPYLET